MITTSFTADDGVEIVYDLYDGHDDGLHPLVVLHHGFAVDASINWVATGVVAALEAAGRTVVTLDARGHGRSGKPHDPAAYGESKMARDLMHLVDVLAVPSYDLVGYSMGAIVSSITATRDPRVRRLVIGGVGAGVVELGGVDTRAMPSEALVQAMEAADPSTIVDPAVQTFRSFADAIGADRRALAAQARHVHAEPIDLSRITVPTLLLAGADDPLAARPEVLAAAIPGATLEVVAGDHLTAIGDPRFIAALLAHLDHPTA